MAYKRFLEVNGTLNTAEELNDAWTRETGDPEPWADPNNENWRAWIEHENGKTYFLTEE